MGGYGSGRSGGRPTVEDGLTLDLAKLLRDRLLRPGQAWGGSLTWTNTRTKREIASIGYQVFMGEASGRLRLHYTTTRPTGEKHASDYWVDLITTAQPFGGRRWWFLCPRTGERVAKLHLPNGAFTFASRKAYRLGYRSQRETPRDRALSRAFGLRHRLGADGGIGDYVPRPKGMRLPTYERYLTRIWRAEGIVNAHCKALLAKLRRIEGKPVHLRR